MTSRLFAGILSAVERGAFPRTRKLAWRLLYNRLSRSWRDDDWRFMNYGFVPDGAPFPLRAEDEPERASIGLYQQAMTDLPVAGARVLEIGSGRGGGVRYIARYFAPSAVTGLDYSAETVRLARKLNSDTAALSFEVGDAENLPFADGAFDIVVNIESSHCYGDVPRFAREVGRVLAPGGWFSFADMRGRAMIAELEAQLQESGLDCIAKRDISQGVVAALDAAEERKQARIRHVRILRRFITEFAGSKGTLLYNGLRNGDVVYVAHRYRKPPAAPVLVPVGEA
jgi:SAM-dependent methyltransferase